MTSTLSAPREEGEARLLRFEAAWRTGPPPRIEDFHPPSSSPDGAGALIELIAVDLEFRWCRPLADRAAVVTHGPPIFLEAYLERFSELGGAHQIPPSLLQVEYRVRRLAGNRPAFEEYGRRFGRTVEEVRLLLGPVDEEIDREFPTLRGVPPPPIVSVPEFLAALGQSQLLPLDHLNDLVLRDLRGEFADAKAPARVLLHRGSLSAFQANQLLRGHGSDLVLGPYLLIGRLGEGATSRVYQARHRRMRRQVALKVLRQDLMDRLGSDALLRFQREVEAVGRLSHPNVVTCHDAGQVGSTHWLAMEYLEGEDLARLIQRSGPLPIAEACDLIRQAAEGLHHAFERGLIHRDIKPSNLFLTTNTSVSRPTRQVKVLDLGLARLMEQAAEEGGPLTRSGQIMGTPDYMAPEQARDPRIVDTRADIYSLGCTLHALLTGLPPFPGGTLLNKMKRHEREVPPSVRVKRPDVPSGLDTLLARALAKQAEDRFSSPWEMARTLRPYAQGDVPMGRPPGSPACREDLGNVENEGVPLAHLVEEPEKIIPGSFDRGPSA